MKPLVLGDIGRELAEDPYPVLRGHAEYPDDLFKAVLLGQRVSAVTRCGVPFPLAGHLFAGLAAAFLALPGVLHLVECHAQILSYPPLGASLFPELADLLIKLAVLFKMPGGFVAGA